MAKPKEEKRYDVFLVKYDRVAQEPSHPRLIMDESDLKLLFTQKPGIQYVPQRWLKHENFQHDLPFLFLRGNILGIIVPSGELISIQGIREKAVLLGSLPSGCYRCKRHASLNEAHEKFDQAWKNLEAAHAELMKQIEIAENQEEKLR